MLKNQLKRLPRRKLNPRARIYRGAPLTVTTQTELDNEAAMTPARIRAIRAALIPELRELLDARSE